MQKRTKLLLFWPAASILLVLSSLALFVVLPVSPEPNTNAQLGVTFSPRAAEFLGLDWHEVFDAMLNDLHPDIVRIPVYWNLLEPEQNQYDWEAFDYQMERIKESNTKVILAVGHKLPRWPECHLPAWIQQEKDFKVIEQELFEMVADVVDRYKDHPSIAYWQVQNEVLFPFGVCPEWSSDRSSLVDLVEIVKEHRLPHQKVMTTDSGELSLWLRTSTLPIDALGVSLYRVVYNPRHDYFHWPVNPYFYKLHAMLVRPFVDEILISELQMEPWGPESVDQLSDDEVYLSFHPLGVEERIDFARRTGASVILGWGVEWWYYMKEFRHNPEYWNEAINAFSS